MNPAAAARWPGLVAALWWGSLSTIGLLVVPLLFRYLPSPAMAGATAARLFAAQTWVSVGCCFLLLMSSRPKEGVAHASRVQAAIVFIALGLLLALLAEFGVAPRIVARENLRLWHGVGSAMYLGQWLCATLVLWRLLAPPREGSAPAGPEQGA
ncbi:MAG: hypothetical protein JWQ03_2793 [Variovorax sp.]|nr:hypothetical protein [Variovorax sp.]